MNAPQPPGPVILRELFTAMGRDPAWSDDMIAAMSATHRADPAWPWQRTFLAAMGAAAEDGGCGNSLRAVMRREAGDAGPSVPGGPVTAAEARAHVRAVVAASAARGAGWDQEAPAGDAA